MEKNQILLEEKIKLIDEAKKLEIALALEKNNQLIKDLQFSLYEAYDFYAGITCRRLFEKFIEFFAIEHSKNGSCKQQLLNGEKVNKTLTVLHLNECIIKTVLLKEFHSKYEDRSLDIQKYNRCMNKYVHSNEVMIHF